MESTKYDLEAIIYKTVGGIVSYLTGCSNPALFLNSFAALESSDATYPTENTTDFNLKSVSHDCVHLWVTTKLNLDPIKYKGHSWHCFPSVPSAEVMTCDTVQKRAMAS